MTQPQVTISTLVETPDLLVRRGEIEGQSGRPLVIFSCAHKNAISGEWLEYIGNVARLGRPAIYVTDRCRSWYGAPGLVEDITTAVLSEMDHLGATEVDTLGGSMGAYGAIGFATRIPVKSAVALAPRFTSRHDIVDDHRLRAHLRQFQDTMPFKTLREGLAAAQHSLILHGTEGPDLRHSGLFGDAPGLSHWILPDIAHEVMVTLKSKRALTPILSAALNERSDVLEERLRNAGARPIAEMADVLTRNLAEWVPPALPSQSPEKPGLAGRLVQATGLFRKMKAAK